MEEPKPDILRYQPAPKPAGLRLRRVIVLETLLIALAGMIVWGIAWEIGYPTAGLITAIIIWLAVSPIIEMATVNSYRRSARENTPRDETPRG